MLMKRSTGSTKQWRAEVQIRLLSETIKEAFTESWTFLWRQVDADKVVLEAEARTFLVNETAHKVH